MFIGRVEGLGREGIIREGIGLEERGGGMVDVGKDCNRG